MPEVTKTQGVAWPLRVGPPSRMPRMNSRSCVEIHGAMLEIHRDGIGVGAGHFHALRVGIDSRAKPRAGIVHRLVIFPQLDHFVEAARLVIVVDAGRLHSGVDRGSAAAASSASAPRPRPPAPGCVAPSCPPSCPNTVPAAARPPTAIRKSRFLISIVPSPSSCSRPIPAMGLEAHEITY